MPLGAWRSATSRSWAHERAAARPWKKGGAIMRGRIEINSAVHFGKPCIAGTRIPVQSVLELVREGIAFDQIIRDYYPDIQPDDVRACIQYAIDILTAEDIHLASAQ